MTTHDSYMTNCMHQNIIKCIPCSFKTSRSRSVLQVKFNRTIELVIVNSIIVWLVWLTYLDNDLMLRLCDELFDFVIKFETDTWYLHDLRATFGQIRLLCLICLPGVLWWLSGSSSRCPGLVCGLWLWYFLIILTIFDWFHFIFIK